MKRRYCLACYSAGRLEVGRRLLYITKDGLPVVTKIYRCCRICKGNGFVHREKS